MDTKQRLFRHPTFIGLALLVGACAAGCSQQKQNPAQTPAPVQQLQAAQNYATYMKTHPHPGAGGQ